MVTGGDGFLGRHLVSALSAAGARLLVVDDGRLDREPAQLPADAERVWAAFESPKALTAVRDFSPDAVFHLAAMHFVPDCDRDPSSCLAANVLSTDLLLSALRGCDVRSFVFCSSAVVYGFADTPRREDNALSPQHIYAHSKWLGEGLLRNFGAARPDVRTVAARLFNLVGPGDTARHVLPEIIDAVLEGRTLQLGNTWPQRDYIHAADVADALVELASGPAGETVVNVATGHGRTVTDVIDVVGQVVGATPRVERDPSRERATDGHLIADISRITARTSWRPRRTFEQTMRELLVEKGVA